MTPREQELLQTVNELRIENALLRQKIDLLVKRVFGSSREPLDKNQLELLAQPETSATVAAIGGRAGKGTGRALAQGASGAFAREPAGGGGSAGS